MNEYKRKIRRGPFERWWSDDGIRYANVPGGVLAKMFNVQHGRDGSILSNAPINLCFIPGVALMFREYEDVIPADEAEGLDEEEVVVHQVKFVRRSDVAALEQEGWKVFK